MPTIGTFTKAGDIFTGTILTLTLNVTVNIVPADRVSDQSPDYRIHWGCVDCGAAWKRTNDAGQAFLSVKLDDPAFPHPIYASLFADDDENRFNLVWSRPKGR
ncbi:hypothetical protein MMA231_03655 (plasmid) [Asticcacaulis sp. MM231]|uniref:DUF736 domain-containing protein n=1 Tax=Asticcacaulis sp. MM231 TaxID=3157666 RepID=UPI0032D5ADB3